MLLWLCSTFIHLFIHSINIYWAPTMYQSELYGVKMNYDGPITPRGAHEVYSLKKIDLKKITSFSLRAKSLFVYWP